MPERKQPIIPAEIIASKIRQRIISRPDHENNDDPIIQSQKKQSNRPNEPILSEAQQLQASEKEYASLVLPQIEFVKKVITKESFAEEVGLKFLPQKAFSIPKRNKLSLDDYNSRLSRVLDKYRWAFLDVLRKSRRKKRIHFVLMQAVIDRLIEEYEKE
jgi:hypothetical protein